MNIEVTDEEFQEKVLDSKTLVLIDFYAPWCAPCRVIATILEEIEKDLEDKVKIYKLNVDENNETANKYGVMSIPTLAIFKNGEVVNTTIGILSKNDIIKMIEEIKD